MNLDLSIAFNKINDMINGLIAALPNIILALIIFGIFFFSAKAP